MSSIDNCKWPEGLRPDGPLSLHLGVVDGEDVRVSVVPESVVRQEEFDFGKDCMAAQELLERVIKNSEDRPVDPNDQCEACNGLGYRTYDGGGTGYDCRKCDGTGKGPGSLLFQEHYDELNKLVGGIVKGSDQLAVDQVQGTGQWVVERFRYEGDDIWRCVTLAAFDDMDEADLVCRELRRFKFEGKLGKALS